MAVSSNIVLFPPNILVYAVNSTLGMEIQSGDFMFGIVAQVPDATTSISVDNYVLFRISDALQIKYGSTLYYMIDIAKVKLKEIPLS